jgi:hypothetical protein
VAVNSNSFRGPLIFDDLPSIIDNPTIRQLWPSRQSQSHCNGETVSGRPLVSLLLAANCALGRDCIADLDGRCSAPPAVIRRLPYANGGVRGDGRFLASRANRAAGRGAGRELRQGRAGEENSRTPRSFTRGAAPPGIALSRKPFCNRRLKHEGTVPTAGFVGAIVRRHGPGPLW